MMPAPARAARGPRGRAPAVAPVVCQARGMGGSGAPRRRCHALRRSRAQTGTSTTSTSAGGLPPTAFAVAKAVAALEEVAKEVEGEEATSPLRGGAGLGGEVGRGFSTRGMLTAALGSGWVLPRYVLHIYAGPEPETVWCGP